MIALYCRVSTVEQSEQGFSIENQKERLEAYCKSQGWEDYRFYIDDGYTGTSMDRPALKRMIRHADERKITTVVVYKLDRLGRKQKDVLYLLEEIFDANNVAFKSATEPFDTATPLGKAMLGILAVFAQLERDTIVERTTSGRRQRVRRGLWYGGRVPFGYEWDGENLIVKEEEAHLVRMAFSMYLEGQSTLYISDWLTSRTKARFFDHNVVKDMLQRPIYTGRMNNAGILVDGKHDAIIDLDTFDRAQKEMAKRKDGRPPVGEYFLSGMLRCGICGGSVIHVYSTGKKYEYYACKAQHVRRKGDENYCSLGYTPMKKLDEAVAERLKQISLQPERVESEINHNEPEQPQLIESLQEELKSVDAKLERWYDAFERGMIDPEKLSTRIDGLEAEKKTILLRMEEIDDPILPQTDDLIDTLVTIGQNWDILKEDEQKTILRTAIDHITVYPKGEFEFVWNV